MSKKCTDPAVGRLLARYEFGKVTEEEKKAFEQHLLECEACYKEFYSFQPVTEIIKNNIHQFQKAAGSRKGFIFIIKENIVTAIKNVWDGYLSLPQPVKVAVPGIAVVLMVLIVYTLSFRPHFRNYELVVQTGSIQSVLHPPEHIESKAYGDSIGSADLNDISESKSIAELFRKKMYIEKNFERRALVFRWPRVSDIDHYEYHLSLVKNQKMISPVTTVQDTLFMYPIENIPKKQKIMWYLNVYLKNERKYTFTKKFTINY